MHTASWTTSHISTKLSIVNGIGFLSAQFSDLTSEKMVTLDVRQLKKTYQVYDEPRLLIAGTSTFFVILLFFLHPVHHKDTAWIALLGVSEHLLLPNAENN